MIFPTITLSDEITTIENFLTELNQKEDELIRKGSAYLEKGAYDAGRAGQRLSQMKGSGDFTSVLIGVCVALTVQAAGAIYLKSHGKKLEAERSKFARENVDKIEELGQHLRNHILKMLDYFSEQDCALLSLDQNSLLIYRDWLTANSRYQDLLIVLLQRYDIFFDYYSHIEEWAGRKPNPELSEPINTDAWISNRVISADHHTRNSSSFVYNYSLQGHLLLSIPEMKSVPALSEYQDRAKELFKLEIEKYDLPNKLKYIEHAKASLSIEKLVPYFDHQHSKVKRKLIVENTKAKTKLIVESSKAKTTRAVPWVISGIAGIVALVLFIIVIVIVVIISILFLLLR